MGIIRVGSCAGSGMESLALETMSDTGDLAVIPATADGGVADNVTLREAAAAAAASNSSAVLRTSKPTSTTPLVGDW